MKLTGRKAVHAFNGEVTIITEIMHSNNTSMLAYIDDAMNLNEDILSNFKLFDGVATNSCWQPDWSSIKYNHLRMDADGRWWSFDDDCDLVFNQKCGEWVDLADKSCQLELHIKYRHPNPALASYTRPHNY